MQLGTIGGTVYFKLDGAQYLVGGKFTFKPQEVVREPREGLSGPVGTTEKKVWQRVSCELTNSADVDFTKLNKFKNGVLTFELANGHAYVLSNATQVGEIEVDGGEGSFPIDFVGFLKRSN